MRSRILGCMILIVLGSLLVPVATASAAGQQPDDGVVIWNDDYVLGAGEERNGDLIVFNGDATLETASRIRGDAVIWSGSADVDGVVEGDLVASNGDIRLHENAHVQGDVVCTWNCSIEQGEGARIDGDVIEGVSLRGLPFIPWGEPRMIIRTSPPDPEPLWLSGPEAVLRWFLRMVRRVVTVLVIAAIGGLVALIWPGATDQVGRAVFDSPGTSVGVGFLTVVAAVTLIVALAITICLSPAAALVALAVGAAGLFGWIAIGARIGDRLLQALNADRVAPLWSAGLGTLLITLITVGLSSAFCLSPLGWLLTFVVGCFGLGAVVLTRFGTTPYIPGRHSRPEAAARPPASTEQLPGPTPVDEEADAEGDEA